MSIINERINRGMREVGITGEYINNYHVILCADKDEASALICDIGEKFEGKSFSVIPEGRIAATLDSCVYIKNAIICTSTIDYDLIELLMAKDTIGGERIVIITTDFNTSRKLYDDTRTNIAYKLFLDPGASTYVLYHPLYNDDGTMSSTTYHAFTLDGMRDVPEDLLDITRGRVLDSIFIPEEA